VNVVHIDRLIDTVALLKQVNCLLSMLLILDQYELEMFMCLMWMMRCFVV